MLTTNPLDSLDDATYVAIKAALRDLNLDAPAMRWLERTLLDVARECLRPGSAGTERALMGKLMGGRWPQDNLTGVQRYGVLNMLDLPGDPRVTVAGMILAIRDGAR